VHLRRIEEKSMFVSEAARDFVDETLESMELAPRNEFHLEPRCRVCRNDLVRKKVNAMLACGGSYTQIVRALGDDNALLDKRDQVTVDSVRTHTTKHFPVQQTAHAAYREILERRARENQVDFVEGVAIALTPMAFYEVVMAKAFRTLVDDGTEVSVETGLRAAGKLQSVLDGRGSSPRTWCTASSCDSSTSVQAVSAAGVASCSDGEPWSARDLLRTSRPR
jgi:hypothetical protein